MARRKQEIPELLAPVGTEEALYAAIEGGADAVYLGGEAFSARAYAGNFSREALEKALVYAHGHGVKVYVAVNTLLFEREWKDATDYIAFLDEVGANGVIVADMGLARYISEHFPRLPLHASTQMSIHSAEGANALAEMGFSRVVPARELSAENIAALVEKTPLEIEVFLHGALCVCHSGQCLFSSLVGGRSGNRGTCAQPCRLPYREGYALSLKDLCLAEHIPSLISSGIASLKIEGRMKSPDYVYGVTRLYRRLLDQGRSATAEEMEYLARLFSRGGFTDGYYTERLGKGMLGVRSQADKDSTKSIETKAFLPKPLVLSGKAEIRQGEKARLSLVYGSCEVTVTGQTPLIAQNAALEEESLKERLCKMGATHFVLPKERLSVVLDKGLFLPVGAQNALRREGVMALEAMLKSKREDVIPRKAAHNVLFSAPPLVLPKDRPWRTVVFYRVDVFESIDRSFFDIDFLPLFRLPEAKKTPKGILMPPVLTDAEEKDIEVLLKQAKERGVTVALCGGLGSARLAAKWGFSLMGDFRLNITNKQSANAYRALGFSAFVLSPELSLKEIRQIKEGGACVFGRIPLMVTERCFIKDNFGCARCDSAALRDHKGVDFPFMREYLHRNLIFNSLPTYMGDKRKELQEAGLDGEHFIFSVESPAEAKALLASYRKEEEIPHKRRFPKESV
ncbi:MAG: U32 family peptidase [Clostridia bacterium]|nr:U32 family peptidase [Clostridia bacterium]